MQAQQTQILDRHDTFFGVCEAIGQDFGFHSNYLRLAMGAGLLFSPMITAGVYLTLGLFVAASRLLFPPRGAKIVAAPAQPVASDNDDAVVAYAQAA